MSMKRNKDKEIKLFHEKWIPLQQYRVIIANNRNKRLQENTRGHGEFISRQKGPAAISW